MRIGSKFIVPLLVVSLFLVASLAPMSSVIAEENDKENYVCELTYNGKTTKYETVNAAINEWNEHGTGECYIKIYSTVSPITEDPIHIEQKGSDKNRTLTIEGEGSVVMKCSDKTAPGEEGYRSVFYITAQSDFTQTPSLTFRNITFDLTGLTKASYGIYASGVDTQRYVRGIFVDTCKFIGDTDKNGYNCVGVGTRQNGSADFTLYNCMGENLHTLFNGYCFLRENETYGLNIIGCTSINGKYFVNNQAGEHSTYIGDCTADYYGDSGTNSDSYGVRSKGSNLWMENVSLTYTGKYATDFDAFVVVKDHNLKTLSLNNCSFNGFDDVTDSLEKGQNKKDIFVIGAITVENLLINGQIESLTTGSSGKYYNFPRYTVTVDNATGGSATVSDGHYDKTTLKTMKGAKLTLNLKINDRYVFEGWDVSSELNIDAVDQFVMVDKDLKITPAFRQVGNTTYKVNVTIEGTGTASSSNNVESGSDFILFTKAGENYRLSNVSVNGKDVGPVAMYTVRNITENVNIVVQFESSPGTTTEISDDNKFVIETNQKVLNPNEKVGSEAISKITDADSNVINQKSVSNLEMIEGKILDVVTTATQTDSERYKDLNDTIQSKITVGSKVTEKIAVVDASQEYLDVANAQIEWLKGETKIDTDPIYMMNVHSDEQYSKISANFDMDIVKQIDDKDGLLAISSGDEGKSGKSSLVLDRDVINGLVDKGFSTLNLTVGLSEVEDLTPEQQAVVGDNTVVFAKLILTDESGNKTEVSNLGGSAKISIEHEFDHENPTFYIYYVTPDGNLELMKDAVYDPYTKTISFVTTHFSQFVIMEEYIEPVTKGVALDWIILIVAITLTVCTIVSSSNYAYGKRH